MHNSASLLDTRLLNPSDLDFDLKWPLKVKSNGVNGVPTYNVLLASDLETLSQCYKY